MVFVVERFSYKLKQQIIAPKKIYCVDTGMINSIAFKQNENLGKLFENIAYTELIRRKSYLQGNWEIYYWKNAQQEEVDFILKQGTKVSRLIQVCYNVEDEKTKEREIKALLKASKELRCSNMLVITNEFEASEDYKGKTIHFIPLWKWLLG